MNNLQYNIYKDLLKIKNHPDFYYFTVNKNNLQEEKENFFASKFGQNPNFRYENLFSESEIEFKRREIKFLKKNILNLSDVSIREVYLEKLSELLLQVKLLNSALNFEANHDEFDRSSKLLYGDFDDYIKSYILNFINKRNPSFAKKICHSYIKSFDSNIDEDFIEYVKSQYNHNIDLKSKNDAVSIKKAFEEVLSKVDIYDWKVELSVKANNISVDSFTNKIYIPDDKLLSDIQLKKIINHEILTHVRRSSRGANSELLILRNGLAYYDKAEEGLAKFSELIITENYEPKNIISSYAIGQAQGLFDNKKKDFKDTFIKMMELFTEVYKYPESKSLDKAWRVCYRIFRGTNCNIPGIVYTKDTIYLSGLLQLYKKSSDLVGVDLWKGKYNFFDKSQTDIVLNLD